ncbi:MAG: sugar phosphate isomerase/epimerase [Lentisphaeraceae bacterium]|nr:sugar phosphate isomerase/epimerase [Lentisphaeraceae bacterium]
MPKVGIGFHTDAFNSTHKSFEQCLQWASENGVKYIEPGTIEGACWIQGLGYFPHVSLLEDPVLLVKKMEGYGVKFSQIDAAYPLSNKDGTAIGVPYVQKAIRWAALAGCPRVATTDGLFRAEDVSDQHALDRMKSRYEQILEVAEAHKVIVNIEVHGYYTTNPDMLDQMLNFCGDKDYLKLNLDTGNCFIAGQDPVAFTRRFVEKVDHCHIKDVTKELADAARGGMTGIALSHCSVGEGVNAQNIRECLGLLYKEGFDGVLSIECEGKGGPMLAKSVAWLKEALLETGFELE